jgi:hypothetical protein
MSDMNPLVVVALAAAVLLLIAYAAFQFRRQCQEYRRRSEQTATTGQSIRTGPAWNPPRVGYDEAHLCDKRPGRHSGDRQPSLGYPTGPRGR